MTATHRTTLARPMASSTSTSQKCAPKDCDTGPSGIGAGAGDDEVQDVETHVDRRQSATDIVGSVDS